MRLNYLFLQLVFCFSIQAIAQGVPNFVVRPLPYNITSEVAAPDLPRNKVRVTGKVVNENMQPIVNAEVYIMGEDGMSKTNSEGVYELFLDKEDTAIYCYSPGYQEVLVSDYDFKARTTVTINFYLTALPVPEPEQPSPIPPNVAFKPVIYCYSNQPIAASVALNVKGALTFTYPKYGNGWFIEVNKNGMIDKQSDKQYPYLFWEGEIDNLQFQKQDAAYLGELIKTDNLINVMEERLKLIGLNRTEMTDFITFWMPKMMRHEYVFVQFLVDDAYATHIAELKVKPQPDSMKRIYLLFAGFSEKPTFKTKNQTFMPFERSGFTVVEWGGTELKMEL